MSDISYVTLQLIKEVYDSIALQIIMIHVGVALGSFTNFYLKLLILMLTVVEKLSFALQTTHYYEKDQTWQTVEKTVYGVCLSLPMNHFGLGITDAAVVRCLMLSSVFYFSAWQVMFTFDIHNTVKYLHFNNMVVLGVQTLLFHGVYNLAWINMVRYFVLCSFLSFRIKKTVMMIHERTDKRRWSDELPVYRESYNALVDIFGLNSRWHIIN